MKSRQAAVGGIGSKTPDTAHLGSSDELCGIVLAGGEGKRLRPFIHLLRQDLLPKQYVNFIGNRSMLEHTIHRAEKLISPRRLFTVINRAHLSFPEVNQQISKRLPGTVVVQPENKETGPGLLLPLVHLTKKYPNSIVAIFPSDHFVLEEENLINHVRLAHTLVKKDPSRIVLLGIEPDGEESEYGYLLPEKAPHKRTGPFQVSCFIEKPDLKNIRDLISRGALWNTMVMVFRAETILRLVCEVAPALSSTFQQIYDAIGTPAEECVIRKMYEQLEPVNFSKELLEPFVQAHASNLLALPVRDVLWSDWGTETRVMEVLRKTGSVMRLNGLSVDAHKPLHVRHTNNKATPAILRASHTIEIFPRSKPGGVRVTTRSAI
jgi:mannose-1-phosphate guanylyltransferase